MSENQELVRKVKALEGLDLDALKAEYAALYGVEPVTKNVTALRNQIARKLNRQDIDARKKAAGKNDEAPTPEAPATVTDRIAALTEMNVPQLREEYERYYGRTCSSRNKRFLLKKLAEAVRNAVGAETGKVTVTAKFERKPSRSKNISKERTPETKGGKLTAVVKDERVPPRGTVIERPYKGRVLKVTVTEDGFEYAGKPYRSLSAVAMAITGAKAMNGFLFFRMGQYAKKEKAGK